MSFVVTGVVVAATSLFVSTYSSVDNAKHAETNASNDANVAQDQANEQIAQAKLAQQNKLNQQANATQVAQARVKAVSDPDASTIMTSPLGQAPVAGGGTGPTGQTPSTQQPAPGMIVPAGKTTIGG